MVGAGYGNWGEGTPLRWAQLGASAREVTAGGRVRGWREGGGSGILLSLVSLAISLLPAIVIPLPTPDSTPVVRNPVSLCLFLVFFSPSFALGKPESSAREASSSRVRVQRRV